MPRIYLVYSNSNLPLSPLIRWRTGSAYSHVAIILEKDATLLTLDSLVTHSAMSSKGVRFTTLKSFLAHATDYRITELPEYISTGQFELLMKVAEKYEGTKYDLRGAIGLGLGEDWQEDDCFWCSEWVAYLLKIIGCYVMQKKIEHRIDPSHCLAWAQKTIEYPRIR